MKAKLLSSVAGVLLLLLADNPLFGQATGGIGFFAPGIHTVNFGKLNAALPAGYPEITNKPFLTSGVGYAVFSNIMIGGEGGTMHAGTFSQGDQTVELENSFSYFSVGYMAYNKKGIMLFPAVGIGNNEMTFYIHQQGEDVSFADVVLEPFQATTLHYTDRMLKFSATGLYTLKGAKSDKGNAGLMLGLEVGYQIGYQPGKWNYDNGSINEGPDFDTRGFYFRLMIGGGGVMRK
jgi:hypothetical protein